MQNTCVKLLDCTLRDGGYKNDWNFGLENSRKIAKFLDLAGVDYIETGFLKDIDYDKNKTLYSQIEQINELINFEHKSKISAMIMFSQFDENKIIPKTRNIALDTIRLTFKKEEISLALELGKKIKDYGYELFLNPKNVDMYSLDEIKALVQKANEITPFAFSIVDTKGVLEKEDVISIFEVVDDELSSETAVCFHSHNALGQTFECAKKLTEMNQKRNLILDSTVLGVGKGTGNLNTKEIAKYLKKDRYSIAEIENSEFVLENVYGILKV